ncbi:MAG: hypothetical protein V2A58_17335 [Planctomycetota bacterium]
MTRHLRTTWGMTLMISTALLAAALAPAWGAGPPAPMSYKEIPDPPDEAQRHIVVRAEDRGPVWLYTGFLNCWHPDMDLEMIARLKPRHWRYDLWPFWHPVSIVQRGSSGRTQWGDMRDSPEVLGKFLETMLRLREQGMTWQPVLHHKGRYYGVFRITADMLNDFYDHITSLVKYCRVMGAPFDYYEIANEPGTGPYEGVQGYGFRGTWDEFLGMWDTAYRAIRDAYPDAKIVGPSYGTTTAETLKPFLDHCREKGQKLDVLSWHEICQKYGCPTFWVEPDKAQKNIMEIRKLVETNYSDLGIREYHVDEWGETVEHTGPGTQMAYFYYFDLAGVDRAAKSHWTQDDLDGILVSPKTPRTSYWCWVEYAKQDGGARLQMETDDRCVVALASRHDETKEVRVLLARSKRHTGEEFAKRLPPVKVRIDVNGIPVEGEAELTTLTLGPGDGPLWEEDLAPFTVNETKQVSGGALSLEIPALSENQVVSIRLAPPGTRAREAKAAAEEAKQTKVSEGIEKGIALPHVVFREGFEEGFADGETILGKRGWTHAKNETSALRVFRDPKIAHAGERYAEFTENYWATNDCFHSIPEQKGGVLEVTAWYRFPDYEGNRNGKGIGATYIGLCDTPDRSVDRDYVSFKFGTNEQNGYSVVIASNGKVRRIHWTDASGLRDDVRGKWYQVSLVLDMEAKRVTARHRSGAQEPWKVFHSETYPAMDWTPKYVLVSAYNQDPDWRFCVDDVEVRSNVKQRKASLP